MKALFFLALSACCCWAGIIINPFVFTAAPPGTSYANAGGSGDRSESILMVESNVNVLAAETALINGVTGSGSAYFNSYPTYINDGDWFSFDLGSSRLVDEIKWHQSSAATHGTWKVQGSSDHTTWSDVGSSFTLGGSTTQTITAISANLTSYRYLRLMLMTGPSSNAPYLYEVEFKIGPVSGTSYLNTLGGGDRTATITTTTGGSFYTGGAASTLVNGSTGTGLYFTSVGTAGDYFQYDFGTAQIIDEIELRQGSAATHGTWKMEGSADGSSFSDLGSSFTLGGSDARSLHAFTNSSGYRYYRLTKVSGSNNLAPWLNELRFKIATP